jgi:hypothetical protein
MGELIMKHDSRTILIEYKGKNPKLTSGTFYSRDELAKAFGVSKTFVCERLKDRASARDSYFKKINGNQHQKKLMTFVGDDDRFNAEEKYTLKTISEITGIKENALSKRIGKATVFNSHHVRPTSKHQNYGGDRVKKVYPTKKTPVVTSVFESHAEFISAQWLRRKL